MIKIIFSFLILFIGINVNAQDAEKLHQTGREFMRQADYSNAVLVLNRALQLDSNNLEIAKDLGLNYYFSKNYKKAIEIYNPILERSDADDQCYQIAADIYLAMDNSKECEKIYKAGLKKFPDSGPLYNEYGELLWGQNDNNAILQWEKGIEKDPSFSKNYYNACKYYYLTTDKTWSILYGEIFINIEPTTTLTPEIKDIVYKSYKKLFLEPDLENVKNNPTKNIFAQVFLKTMNKQGSVAISGITPESLTMIRTRFILDWFNDYADKYPFKLFDLQQQYLQSDMFNAYNQWIFTASQNLPAYQKWISANTNEYNEFIRFQKSRLFKIPKGQYYQSIK